MIRTLGTLALALLLVVAITPTHADETSSKWEFDAQLYAWIPGNYGSVTVKGNTIDIGVSPNDVLNLLWKGDALAGAASFSVGYERFSFMIDSFGGFAEPKVNETIPTRFCDLAVDAKDKTTFVITDFLFGYRVGAWPLPQRRRPFTLGVYTGTRYVRLHNSLRASGGVIGVPPRRVNVSDGTEWADPLLGIRWELPILEPLSATFRADIGGFGASSDLAWAIRGDLRWWTGWSPWSSKSYVAAGYRVVAFDRSPSAGDVDLQYRGPLIGVGFVF